MRATPDVELASPHKLRERIRALQKLRLEDASVDFLKERLLLLFRGYGLTAPILNMGQKIYRGVKWDSTPSRTSEVSYPPADRVTKYGRANRPHQPMFYASIARSAVLFETRAKPGDHLAISRWSLTDKVWANKVGYSDATLARSNRTNLEKQEGNSHPSARNKIVHEFLAEQFTTDIPSGEEHRYKISVAIAEKLCGDLTDVSHNTTSRIETLLYPSLAMRANSDNLVMSQTVVDSYLQLEQVEYVRVDEWDGDSQYKIKVIDFANRFVDGAIQWVGRPPRWQLAAGEALTISVNEHGQWVAHDTQGRPVEPY